MDDGEVPTTPLIYGLIFPPLHVGRATHGEESTKKVELLTLSVFRRNKTGPHVHN